MGIRFTRRAVAVVVLIVTIVAIGGAVAVRVSEKAAEPAAAARLKAPVTLELVPGDIVHVESHALARWLPVSGTLQPLRQATVKAKVAGEVRQLAVREGEPVRAGQVIARLDTADLEAKLLERIGVLESARAQLALAEKTRAMNQRLLREKFISQNAFDGSDSSFSVAQGNVKSADAQVRLAQSAVRDAAIVAPLSGVVARRHVQPGEEVAPEAPIVTIVDLAELELAALVPSSDVPEIRIGMPVELSVDGFGERRFAGRIERINPATEPGTRAIHVYVGLANRDATLRSGMFATGRIALATSAPVASLPLAAVRTEAGQSFVWIVDDGRLARRPVTLGRRDDEAGRVEVRTPLPPRLPVLAARFDNLKEGATAIVKATVPTSSNAKSEPTRSTKPAG